MNVDWITRPALAGFAALAFAGAWGCQGDADVPGLAEPEKPGRNAKVEEKAGHDAVRISTEELKEFGIELAKAGPGEVAVGLDLPGEVVLNPDRLAHVFPLVPGRVLEVRKALGDVVAKGEVMAVIESRELSDLKASWLAARERASLARVTFQREQRLWKQKISSEQDYLNAKNALAEARIELRSAEQKLHALGFSDKDLKRIASRPDRPMARFEITAPIGGTVIDKHITLGEKVGADSNVFTIADLDTVWVFLTVFQKDLALVREGQDVLIRGEPGGDEAEGRIDYLSPIVEESTRTAKARVVLDNKDHAWRPGRFVTGSVAVDVVDARVVVPRTAVIEVEGKDVVFVSTPEGFVPRPVKTGRFNGLVYEVLAGLDPGDTYVATRAFTLKAELQKGELGDDDH